MHLSLLICLGYLLLLHLDHIQATQCLMARFGSNCFLTDNRNFSDQLPGITSRMHSEITIDISGDNPMITNQLHICSPTHEIDCASGIDICTQAADSSRMNFSGLSGSTGRFTVNLIGAANNPCVTGSPDIDYNGTITVTVSSMQEQNDDVQIDFSGFVEPFPAFEMYWSADDINGNPIFQQFPALGSSPWNLFGLPNVAVSGHGELTTTT